MLIVNELLQKEDIFMAVLTQKCRVIHQYKGFSCLYVYINQCTEYFFNNYSQSKNKMVASSCETTKLLEQNIRYKSGAYKNIFILSFNDHVTNYI